jgi:curli biogenesis system outer membrane secretion channel CsgG
MHTIKKALGCLSIISAMVLLTGCSVMAPQYNPTPENVRALQSAGTGKVNVGKFTAKTDDVNQLSIRASSYESPTNGSFADYLQTALQTELTSAKRFDAASAVSVSGELQENTLSGAVGTGTAHISARFVVQKANANTYDKVLSNDMSWDSPFIGAIGIPAAAGNYVVNVQKLLEKLFADPEFEAAIK